MEVRQEFSRVVDNQYRYSANVMSQQNQLMACSVDVKMHPNIELDAQATSPYFQPVKLKGSLDHDFPRQFNGKVDASYGEQYRLTTSTKGGWTHEELLFSPRFYLKLPQGSLNIISDLAVEKWRRVRASTEIQDDSTQVRAFSTDVVFSKTQPAFSFTGEDKKE